MSDPAQSIDAFVQYAFPWGIVVIIVMTLVMGALRAFFLGGPWVDVCLRWALWCAMWLRGVR
jgi:hypothetical protein